MRLLKLQSLNAGRRSSRGFTLLEVMLAFVIFALSFASVLEIMAGSMRGIRRASDDAQTALLAQSIMDSVGIEIPLEEGGYNGVELDRFQWQLDIYPFIPGDVNEYAQDLAEVSGIELYKVVLDVEWETGNRPRNMRFSTIRSVLAGRSTQ